MAAFSTSYALGGEYIELAREADMIIGSVLNPRSHSNRN